VLEQFSFIVRHNVLWLERLGMIPVFSGGALSGADNLFCNIIGTPVAIELKEDFVITMPAQTAEDRNHDETSEPLPPSRFPLNKIEWVLDTVHHKWG
jgi:hypothetical protein